MKRFVSLSIMVCLTCLASGCTTLNISLLVVQQQDTFKAAGCPADNKSSLCGTFCKTFIDGKSLFPFYFSPPGPPTAWLLEMLPGRHHVRIEWGEKKYGGGVFSGEFVAEKGITYYLLVKRSTLSSSAGTGYAIESRLKEVAIGALPSSVNVSDASQRRQLAGVRTIPGSGEMVYDDSDLLRNCNIVAHLRP
jgi:hypothetical protein